MTFADENSEARLAMGFVNGLSDISVCRERALGRCSRAQLPPRPNAEEAKRRSRR
jgi:hypothetical protein